MTDLLQATTAERLIGVFGQIVVDANGTGFAIAALPTTEDVIVTQYHLGASGWQEDAAVAGYVPRCPITRRVAASATPFFWSGVLSDDADPLSKAVAEMARNFGISEGLLIPVHMQDSQMACIFVRIGADVLLPHLQQWLVMLAITFHTRLMQVRALGKPELEHLSEREGEVLRWLAEGKSSEDVAEIMGISPATVMFHYRNVAGRYGTLNRTHTVVEALRRGALALG